MAEATPKPAWDAYYRQNSGRAVRPLLLDVFGVLRR